MKNNIAARFAIILSALAFCMLLPFAADAAAISCGDCHSIPPVDGNNCSNDARALHGVHVNYSSSDMPKSAATNDKCAYCHTATTGTAPTETHMNFYINVTSTAAAPGLDYDQTTGTCMNACHRNEGATAKWGNYTGIISEGVTLTCNSCHDDSSASSMGLSGAHAAHLGTAITVTGLDASDNTDCDACHPDNTGDMWSDGKADDGSVKAYPHASDGTNVATDNAEIDAGLSASRQTGSTDTCAAACHSNASTDAWDAGTLTCSSCHNDTADGTTNDGAAVPLGGAHSAHFDSFIGGMTGITCSNCHTVPGAGDTSHVSALPVASDNATLIAGVSFNDTANTCAAACHTNAATDVWTSGTLSCDSCHYYEAAPDPTNNDNATVPLTVAHSGHFNAGKTCDNCHAVPFGTSHVSAMPVAQDNAVVTIAYGTWYDQTNTCNNPGDTALGSCHTGDVFWGNNCGGGGGASLTCESCHSYPGDNNDWPAGNGHTVRFDGSTTAHMTATVYDPCSDTYNAVCADPNKCGKCHYGLTQTTHHKKLGVNVVPAPGNDYCSSMTIDVTTSFSDVTCSNVKCHSGKTTPNWW